MKLKEWAKEYFKDTKALPVMLYEFNQETQRYNEPLLSLSTIDSLRDVEDLEWDIAQEYEVLAEPHEVVGFFNVPNSYEESLFDELNSLWEEDEIVPYEEVLKSVEDVVKTWRDKHYFKATKVAVKEVEPNE